MRYLFLFTMMIGFIHGPAQDPFTFLTETEAKDYISNYRNYFDDRKETHTKSVFIPKENFSFIRDFVNKYADYEYIAVHLANYKHMKAKGQVNEDQITLFMAPAFRNKRPDYTAFKNYYDVWEPDVPSKYGEDFNINSLNHGELCPSRCDEYTDGWGGTSYALATNQEIKTKPSLIFLAPDTAETYKGNYKRKFAQLNKKHSYSIFMNWGAFKFMGDFFDDPTYNAFTGVRVYLLMYKKMVAPGQVTEKQISVLFVPTTFKNGKHEPDFNAFKVFFDSKPDMKETYFPKSINHGELCPSNCPAGEN